MAKNPFVFSAYSNHDIKHKYETPPKKKKKFKNIIPFLLWVKLKCSSNRQINARPKCGEVIRPMPIESKRQSYQQIKWIICKATVCLVIKNNSHLVDITIWKLQKTNIAHPQESSAKEHTIISCTCQIRSQCLFS